MFEACTLIDVSIVYTILSYWFDYEDILYKLLNLNSSYYVFFPANIYLTNKILTIKNLTNLHPHFAI